MKILFGKEIAERLNVGVETLYKKEFQQRLKLPIQRMGRRIYIPEPKFEEWVLNPTGADNEQI